jgi:predicted transcriptional regulator
MATEHKKLTKKELIRSFEELPESVTVGDFADHLADILGIEEGLAPDLAGRTVSHEDLLERISGGQAIEDGRTTLRREVVKSLSRLPEDATADEIEYRVQVVLTLTRRMSEAEAGRKVGQAEARERLRHWLD